MKRSIMKRVGATAAALMLTTSLSFAQGAGAGGAGGAAGGGGAMVASGSGGLFGLGLGATIVGGLVTLAVLSAIVNESRSESTTGTN